MFSTGLPTELPITVVNKDGSSLSRQVVRMVNASPDVEVTSHVPSLIEARQALMAREAYGVLLIPENMGAICCLGVDRNWWFSPTTSS